MRITRKLIAGLAKPLVEVAAALPPCFRSGRIKQVHSSKLKAGFDWVLRDFILFTLIINMTVKNTRIAILINHPPEAHFWTEVRQAFVDSFALISREVQLDFYDPFDKQEYPVPSQYELIILSGGKADASASDPWILKMLEFVRKTASENSGTKMLGICWGHQAMIRAFGGHVAAIPSGPIVRFLRITKMKPNLM